MTRINTDLIVDNLRNLQDLREKKNPVAQKAQINTDFCLTG